MIPIPRMSSPYYAKYTIIFSDSLPITEEKLKSILYEFDNTNKLFDMIYSKFQTYEFIVGDVFKIYDLFQAVYNEYKDYYIELLINYNKAYDYAQGNKRRTIRHDTSNTSKSGSKSNSNNGSDEHYDLPNKVVNNPDGYMTSKDKYSGSDSGTYSEDGDNAYDSEVSVIYDNEFLDLKRKYLAQIRNVYSEFADKFEQCFMKVFN